MLLDIIKRERERERERERVNKLVLLAYGWYISFTGSVFTTKLDFQSNGGAKKNKREIRSQ